MRWFIIVVIASLLFGCEKPLSFEEAEALYHDRNYRNEEAALIAAYSPLADAGDYRAQLRAGLLYIQKGPTLNYARAAKYFMMAAEHGDRDAMYFIGTFYRDGKGLPNNIQLAEKYWLKAAEAGSASSMMMLGRLYQKISESKSYEENLRKARAWFWAAHKHGEEGGLLFMSTTYPFSDDLIRSAALEYAMNLVNKFNLKPNPNGDPFRHLDGDSKKIEDARMQGLGYAGAFGTEKKPETFLSID